MRSVCGVLALAALLTVAVHCGEAADYIYVKEITMHMSDGNATFDLNYSLETFAKLYVLALGCRYLETDLLSFFKGCGGVKLLRANTNYASVEVTNAGKYVEGRYLFDPLSIGSKEVPLRGTIPRFTVISPEGRACTFYNVTSLRSIVREAKAFSNSSGSAESPFNGSLNTPYVYSP
ncbi:MAG: hypothetical protein A4E48_00914 [Methanosaeta sp. PtaU1.Bin060]|nr:MAG: hypothetical protein A4E48_00914 [Methanosaeta sp. PtaU1.Bin060]